VAGSPALPSTRMEPVLNPDGSQAISAEECELYLDYIRTLSDRHLVNELEKWRGFSRNRVMPWASEEWCERVCFEEQERRAIRNTDG
jgi:hypothetical protein